MPIRDGAGNSGNEADSGWIPWDGTGQEVADDQIQDGVLGQPARDTAAEYGAAEADTGADTLAVSGDKYFSDEGNDAAAGTETSSRKVFGADNAGTSTPAATQATARQASTHRGMVYETAKRMLDDAANSPNPFIDESDKTATEGARRFFDTAYQIFDDVYEAHPGSHLDLYNPPRPDSEFESTMRNLNDNPYINLDRTQADGATLLLELVRLQQLAMPEGQQTDAAREALAESQRHETLEAARIARVRADPEAFADVVTEETKQPGGPWAEMIAARAKTDQVISNFKVLQKQGPGAALIGELKWKLEEWQTMGLTRKERTQQRQDVLALEGMLFDGIADKDGAAIMKAFNAIDTYMDIMVERYAMKTRTQDYAAIAQGWQPPIPSPNNDLRRLRIAAVKYNLVRNQRLGLGGQPEADKLLPAELARRAAQFNDDSRYLMSEVDPDAYQRGYGRGATPLEPYIRDLWAQSADLQSRAAALPPYGDEGQALEIQAKLVMGETERRAQLADADLLTDRPISQGGIGELSDARVYALIQNTAVSLVKLRQTEGDEAARSFLALAGRQAMNLLNGRASSQDFTKFLESVRKGTFTDDEILSMSRKQLDDLADMTNVADSVESDGILRENAQVAFRQKVAEKKAAFATDRTGMLGRIHQQNIERLGREGRQELFPPQRRWLVVSGDYFKADGTPSTLIEVAAASGQLVGIDGLGSNSPLTDSDTRARLKRLSGGRTSFTHVPLLDNGLTYEFIAVDSDPSSALINPNNLEASFLDHIAPNGAAAMPVTLSKNVEYLTHIITQKVDPLFHEQQLPPNPDGIAGNFRWAIVPTQLIRMVPGRDGRLEFKYGHANPVVDAVDAHTLYLFRNKDDDGTISDLAQLLIEMDKDSRVAHQFQQ